jgi:hypothetical protein
MALTTKDRLFFRLQQLLGGLALPLVAPLYVLALKLWGYRIQHLAEGRRICRELFRSHAGPWIICANHLTMIDSLLVTHGLFSLPEHFFRYHRLPWNLPERDNFQKNPFLASFCYLAKCLPVHRGGSREEMLHVMAKCHHLLSEGQVLMIFPEGGRSRSGRIEKDNYAYGVGRLLTECPEARVMCVYLRGEHQDSYGFIPRRGESFYLAVRELPLARTAAGTLREQRRLAAAIIDQLAQMEEEYFALPGK